MPPIIPSQPLKSPVPVRTIPWPVIRSGQNIFDGQALYWTCDVFEWWYFTMEMLSLKYINHSSIECKSNAKTIAAISSKTKADWEVIPARLIRWPWNAAFSQCSMLQEADQWRSMRGFCLCWWITSGDDDASRPPKHANCSLWSISLVMMGAWLNGNRRDA